MSPLFQDRLQTNLSRRDALRFFGLAGAAVALSPSLLRAAGTIPAAAPIPSLGGAQPGFYRFNIGAFEALALNDGGMAPATSESPFGVGEPREKVAEPLHDAFLATDQVRIPFNVLLLRIGSELVMVDAGCG